MPLPSQLKIILPLDVPGSSSKPALYVQLAHEFARRGHSVIFVCYGSLSRRYAEAHSDGFRFTIYDLEDEVSGCPFTVEETLRIEEQYGIPTLALHAVAMTEIFSDYGRRYSWKDITQLILSHARFWEKLFQKESPDAVVDEGMWGVRSVVWPIARVFRVKVVNLITSRTPGRFAITHDGFDEWRNLSLLYESLSSRSLTDDEISRASAFIGEFERGRLAPPYMIINRRKPRFKWSSVQSLFAYIRLYLSTSRERYLLPTPITVLSRWITRVWRLYRLSDSPIWSEVRDKMRFVVFPMQYEPEASILALAPLYRDQIATVANVALSLPATHHLYVKEHPAMVGFRPISDYNRLLRIPNVRLVRPEENTYDLVRRADAVVTITSTVGWEALMLGKPVVVLGEVFYDIFKGVFKATNLGDLPAVVKMALESEGPDYQERLRIITAFLGATYPGEIAMPLPEVYAPPNVRKLCDGILNALDGDRSRPTA